MTTTAGTKAVAPSTIPPLAADLDAGLRRLKLATVRRTAPEVLLTAKTQRWTPEEVLRTLVEAEIAARDASNTANRLKAAAFPVIKTLEGFDVSASSIPQATVDYLASLEWIRAQHNLAIIGPPVMATDCNSCVRCCRAKCGFSRRRIHCSSVCWRRGRLSDGTARCYW